MSKPAAFNDWQATLEVAYETRAVVDRIVDGDTLWVFVSLGLDQYTYESIRMEGTKAPELFTGTAAERAKGAEARDHLALICPPATKLKLLTEKDRMSFGRYVGRLLLADGSFVNDLMNQWLAEKGY